jgi:hypothetical protein
VEHGTWNVEHILAFAPDQAFEPAARTKLNHAFGRHCNGLTRAGIAAAPGTTLFIMKGPESDQMDDLAPLHGLAQLGKKGVYDLAGVAPGNADLRQFFSQFRLGNRLEFFSHGRSPFGNARKKSFNLFEIPGVICFSGHCERSAAISILTLVKIPLIEIAASPSAPRNDR